MVCHYCWSRCGKSKSNKKYSAVIWRLQRRPWRFLAASKPVVNLVFPAAVGVSVGDENDLNVFGIFVASLVTEVTHSPTKTTANVVARLKGAVRHSRAGGNPVPSFVNCEPAVALTCRLKQGASSSAPHATVRILDSCFREDDGIDGIGGHLRSILHAHP